VKVERWLRSRRVVVGSGAPAPAAVGIAGDRIVAVEAYEEPERRREAPIEEGGDGALLPGIVDTHVHINEPGRTDWEGFATATAAAAAGGVTTLVDMPLNSIPATTTAAAFRTKLEAAAGKLRVDVGFWGGAVPGNAGDLEPLHRAGVLGFKAFLVDSGVDEFERIGAADVEIAATEIARLGSVLLVHAELADFLAPPTAGASGAAGAAGADRRSHAVWEASRPPASEAEAIALLARVARTTGARVHVVHLSSAAGLARVRAARREGLALSAESCPHYLVFASEEVPDGGTAWKCAPPIRGADDRETLWRGLADGSIALVASDHSPSPPSLKSGAGGDFFAAWGGIASLQLGLPALWTAASARGFGLERVAEWMSTAPARLAGLDAKKGAIDVGRDADLVLFEPEARFTVRGDSLYHRHPMTPYEGRELAGVVRRTWLRGRPVFDAGQLVGEPSGRTLLREAR
jgi:allantoinase